MGYFSKGRKDFLFFKHFWFGDFFLTFMQMTQNISKQVSETESERKLEFNPTKFT